MQKLVAGFVFLSLIWGPCLSAQDNVSVNAPEVRPQFPQSGYRPLPPHFQPRRVIAADLDKVIPAPPSLPSYEQPAIPADGYLWVPGFWAWRKSVPDYFWVPGTWVRPPQPGLVWTPPYWSRASDAYAFHAGYWAAEVGFYGGIEYGFGYPGSGYQGGRWSHGTFYYNRSCNNFGSVGIANAYGHPSDRGDDSSCAANNDMKRVEAVPSQKEKESVSPRHVEATFEQRRHFELAAMDRSLYSKLNGGVPAIAATPHAGVFIGDGITSSRRQPDQTAASDGNSHTDVPTSSRSSWGEQPTAK